MLFPSDTPSHGTGPGAIAWSDAATCPGGAGTRVALLTSAATLPLAPALPRGTDGRTLRLSPPVGYAAGPHGQIVIAGSIHGRSNEVIQGKAGGPYVQLSSKAPLAPPFALTTAYLGDVALALAPRGQTPQVQVERFFSNVLGIPRPGRGGARQAGPIQAVTVAMDYRSDALVAWVQGASVYAQDLPSSGVVHPVQRIGPAGADVHLAALLSDDNRGMVVWEDRRGTQRSVHFDFSSSGVVFPAPTLLERFASPGGEEAPPASPRLIRLSSESVMLAWTGAGGGHWAIRTAAVDQHGIGQVGTIAAGSGDALLQDLVPGPHGEVMLLFSEPQTGLGDLGDPTRQALFSARGADTSPDRTSFATAQPVAPAGPVGEASLGIDPDTDEATAVWTGSGGAIEYSVRPAG